MYTLDDFFTDERWSDLKPVLRFLFEHGPGPCSFSQVWDATGLEYGLLQDLVKVLVRHGLVTETARPKMLTRGIVPWLALTASGRMLARPAESWPFEPAGLDEVREVLTGRQVTKVTTGVRPKATNWGVESVSFWFADGAVASLVSVAQGWPGLYNEAGQFAPCEGGVDWEEHPWAPTALIDRDFDNEMGSCVRFSGYPVTGQGLLSSVHWVEGYYVEDVPPYGCVSLLLIAAGNDMLHRLDVAVGDEPYCMLPALMLESAEEVQG